MSSSISFDEIESRQGFLATGAKPESIDWLPEPPRAHRHVPIISVDDHLVEPPHIFEGRVSARFVDLAPRVMTEDDGRSEYWLYDDKKHYKVGLNAVVGKITSVNPGARFAVITFALGNVPGANRRLNIYRAGLKVGEIKITGPARDNNTVGDIIAGECQVNDEVKEE